MRCSRRLMPGGSFSSRVRFWMFWLSSITRLTLTSAWRRALWKFLMSSLTVSSSTTGALIIFCMALYRLLPSFSSTTAYTR